MTTLNAKMILAKILLGVIGYIAIFRAYVYGYLGIHFHDSLGFAGIVMRPYYHFLLTLFPYFYSAPYVRLLSNPHYWLKVILDLFLPIMAITAFEKSAYRSRAKFYVPFYFLVPGALYFLATIVVMQVFPSDS